MNDSKATQGQADAPDKGQTPNNNKDQKESKRPKEKQEYKSRFKEGQKLKLVRVRFPGHSKSFPFFIGNRNFQYGQKVVAMSDRGVTVGYINSFPYEITYNKEMPPIRSINKVATDEDIEKHKKNYEKEVNAENICHELIQKLKLDMELTHVELTQFGKKAVFYFIAPHRIDFRDLIKELVAKLKMRIELRQISVRDRAAALGGLGPCGRQLCCSYFLEKFGGVNIKMAINQNFSLSPNKLNGICGQLKCCLKYEDEGYAHKRKKLPKENTFIQLINGDRGKVTKLHILEEHFEVLTDQGTIKRYHKNMFNPEVSPPSDWVFPKRFDHIVNETSQTIMPDVGN